LEDDLSLNTVTVVPGNGKEGALTAGRALTTRNHMITDDLALLVIAAYPWKYIGTSLIGDFGIGRSW
jgi:hypothetical protein